MMKLIDLTEQVFGRLVVVKRIEDYVSPLGAHQAKYLCKCDCGNETVVTAQALRRGSTKSCGCIYAERGHKNLKEKVCNSCKRLLPVENFYKKSNGSPQFICKECKSSNYQQNRKQILSKKRKHYVENIEKERARVKKWRDENKEKRREYAFKHYRENKDYYEKWYKDNLHRIKERRAIHGKAFAKNHKERYAIYAQMRRAKKKDLDNTLTEAQWVVIKAFFDNKCAYCGKESNLQQEHFIPLSKNGEYTTNNIIPACKSCNSSKRDKDFFQWYYKQEFYSKKREKNILKYLNYEGQKQQLTFAMEV